MDNSNNPNSSSPNPTPPAAGPAPTPNWPSTPIPPQSVPDIASSWPPPPAPQQPEPIPATPPASPSWPTAPGPSPLDNPWGAPIQPPPIDGSQSSQPTWVPPTESAPTDLSHLISSTADNGQNPSTAPETLVVSPTSGAVPETTIPTQEHKSIPRWLIGVGAGLLIIVAGASAYFILGVGQPPKGTTSIPAEISKTTVKTPPPIATPAPQPTPATGSANFGQLQGGASQQATSAADLLKQRQGR